MKKNPGLEFDPLDLQLLLPAAVERYKKMLTLIIIPDGELVILRSVFHYPNSACRVGKKMWENWISFKFSSSSISLNSLSFVSVRDIHFSRLISGPLPRSGRLSFLFLEWKQLDWSKCRRTQRGDDCVARESLITWTFSFFFLLLLLLLCMFCLSWNPSKLKGSMFNVIRSLEFLAKCVEDLCEIGRAQRECANTMRARLIAV